MMKKLFVFFAFLFALNASALASAAGSLNQLESLDSVANLLMAAADETIPTSQSCGIDMAQAFQLMNPLHAHIEAAKDKYIQQRQRLKKTISDPSWVQTCESQCHCSLYASTLEIVGFEKLQIEDQRAYRKLSNMAMNQTSNTIAKCARSVTNFCQSSLHRQLLKEISQ